MCSRRETKELLQESNILNLPLCWCWVGLSVEGHQKHNIRRPPRCGTKSTHTQKSRNKRTRKACVLTAYTSRSGTNNHTRKVTLTQIAETATCNTKRIQAQYYTQDTGNRYGNPNSKVQNDRVKVAWSVINRLRALTIRVQLSSPRLQRKEIQCAQCVM